MRSLILFFLLIYCTACSYDILLKRQAYTLEESDKIRNENSEYIKVHLNDGRLAILENWSIDHGNGFLIGEGLLYNTRRDQQSLERKKWHQFQIESIVLLETNEFTGSNFGSPFGMLMVGLSSTLPTLICLTDPKACFGSCPTFYLHKNDSLLIQSEGFTSSVSKSLEESDIDIILDHDGYDQKVNIELKNEALETHYIRYANLLILPKKNEGLVLSTTKNQFFNVQNLTSPKSSSLDKKQFQNIKYIDEKEYMSKSDSVDLSDMEEFILEFDYNNGIRDGIMIRSRQTLLSTYLFYQSLAYMGSSAGHLIAQYERSSPLVKKMHKDIYDLLGGVKVYVQKGSRWIELDEIDEGGPIAKDIHLVRIPPKFGTVNKIKLRATKGLWKIDYVGLVEVMEEVQPLELEPRMAYEDGVVRDDVHEKLIDKEQFLINNPGTSYTLEYHIPDEGPYQIFMSTKGYYVEWMRQEWLQEEDMEMVRIMMKNSKKYLKILAPKYKKRESQMEYVFWNSKFQKGSF